MPVAQLGQLASDFLAFINGQKPDFAHRLASAFVDEINERTGVTQNRRRAEDLIQLTGNPAAGDVLLANNRAAEMLPGALLLAPVVAAAGPAALEAASAVAAESLVIGSSIARNPNSLEFGHNFLLGASRADAQKPPGRPEGRSLGAFVGLAAGYTIGSAKGRMVLGRLKQLIGL